MKLGEHLGVFLCFLGVFAAITGLGYAESEPNDNLASANPIPVNGVDRGSLTSAIPSDVMDFYSVSVPSDGFLQVEVTPAAELRIGITLLDTNGVAELATQDATGMGVNTGIVYSNLQAGNYFIAVRLIAGEGEYGISVHFAPVESVDAEPNDKPADALTFPLNKEMRGHLGFHGGLLTDRYDFYAITTLVNGSLDITVYPDGTLRVALYLIDTRGAAVLGAKDENGKGGSEKVVHNELAAGRYYVLVEATEGYGSYTLTNLHTANPVLNDPEPNNSPAQAVLVSLVPNGNTHSGFGQGQLGYFGGAFRDERDFYRLELPQYGNLQLSTVVPDESNLKVGYSLYDSTLRFIGQGSGYAGLTGGTYYVELWRESGFGGYTFTPSFEPQSAPEPFSQPVTDLSPNGHVENVFLSETTKSIFYRLFLPVDGALTLRTVCSESVWEKTYLLQADGTSTISASESYYTTEERSFSVPDMRAGVYIVELRPISREGAVTLTTVFTPAPLVDSEPNDCWTQLPEKIELNQPAGGHIGYSGNGWRDTNDWFALDVPDDGELSITCESDETLWYLIYLYDYREGSTLRELARAEGYYTTASRTLGKANAKAGNYLVRVYAPGRYGNYQFTVTQKPNRSGDAESNDWAHQALPMTLGGGTVGHLGYDTPFQNDLTDWYKVELPADGTLTVSMHADATLWYRGYLYHADAVTEIKRLEGYYTAEKREMSVPNLRAGVYAIRIERLGNFGTYELYTSFTEKPVKDTEHNNYPTMAVTMAPGEIRQGALGYFDLNFNDRTDWYQVEVPVKGTYRLSWQSENTLWSQAFLYAPDRLTRINSWENYYTSVAHSRDLELEPGTYFIQCWAASQYGFYSLYFGDSATAAVGSLTGNVTSAGNFPLTEVDCTILGRTLKTGFSGSFLFEGLPPGTYPITFSSGAKYYAVTQNATIQPGQTTLLNIVLQESNKTAPADVEKFYGESRDRYVHLYWTPSVSPDVPDGGGYKLYINGQTPLDLGNVLSYRSDGYVNGMTYTFRLTVYDKFGNESPGTTLALDLPGTPVTPTPTPPGTHPTPTPTVTPTSGQPPVPTPTPAEGEATPTPIVAGPVEPDWIWEFDQPELAANGWAEIPGGFDSRTPGAYSTRFAFSENQFAASEDQVGLAVAVNPGEVTFLLTQNSINTEGHPALLRAKVRSNQANAQIVLGALRGGIFSNENVDGTLGMTMDMSSQAFMDQEGILSVVYRPDTGDIINPFLQVAGAQGGTVTVWVDRIEVYILQSGKAYPGELFW